MRQEPCVAAALGNAAALATVLRDEPSIAVTEGGPWRLPPLLYLAYSRVPQADPVGSAELLLDAGADPDAGFLWQGLPTPFTVLTGCFGHGEGGPGRQPAHPHGERLGRLLLGRGAEPNDAQTLYVPGAGGVGAHPARAGPGGLRRLPRSRERRLRRRVSRLRAAQRRRRTARRGAGSRDAVRRHKEQVEAILTEQLSQLTDRESAAGAAEHCAFLLEGAMSRAGLEGNPERLEHARSLASALLDAL